MSDYVIKKGRLVKKGRGFPYTWKERVFTLYPDRMEYATPAGEIKGKFPIGGQTQVEALNHRLADGKPNAFCVSSGPDFMWIHAFTADDSNAWMSAIMQVMVASGGGDSLFDRMQKKQAVAEQEQERRAGMVAGVEAAATPAPSAVAAPDPAVVAAAAASASATAEPVPASASATAELVPAPASATAEPAPAPAPSEPEPEPEVSASAAPEEEATAAQEEVPVVDAETAAPVVQEPTPAVPTATATEGQKEEEQKHVDAELTDLQEAFENGGAGPTKPVAVAVSSAVAARMTGSTGDSDDEEDA